MKVNRLAIDLYVFLYNSKIKKREKEIIFDEEHKKYLNIPYANDGNIKHTYDVFYCSKDNRKNVCIIDIHGGAYLFGNKKFNYPFAKHFIENGFDVMTVDYVPNKGKRETKDIIFDCITCINHFYDNREKYGLKDDIFVLTGDSAGGHLSLLISEMLENKEIGKELGFDMPDFVPICTLVNSPAYDYETLGYGLMTQSARRRMFGRCIDREYMRKYSPKTYINDFKLPLFLSTCKNDFIREESLKLNNDMQNKDNVYKFVDVDSDNEMVDHVHNVTKVNLDESKKVNEEMVEFINRCL